MRSVFVFCAIILCLSACTHARRVNLSGGETGYSIDCRYINKCYKKAAKMCGAQSYALIDKDSAVDGPAPRFSFVGHRSTLLVRCAAK